MIPDRDIVIVDCPPGNSCPMVESVRGADRVILVTEPTPFGLNDLGIALETVREIGIPVDIVMNRCDSGDSRLKSTSVTRARVIARIPEIPRDGADRFKGRPGRSRIGRNSPGSWTRY